MKTKEFLKKYEACIEGAKWAMSVSDDMAEVWDALIAQGKYDWLIWTAIRPGVFPDSVLRKLAFRLVRETPLHDGRTVWDLLADERSRKAVEVAEQYAIGKATDDELREAFVAAYAAYAAYSAAYRAAAYAAADVAADAAADAAYASADVAAAYATAYAAYASYAAAKAAQVKMIAELGNPFKEERTKQ